MRLSKSQIQGIISALSPFLEAASAEIRLYGSRTRDDLRGGDIDLLLLTREDTKEYLLNNKHVILNRIKQKIGDQKIDLKIAAPSDVQEDAFLQSILPGSILLKNVP